MSKWIEQFESHPFQTVWKNLKASLQNSIIDDETVQTSVSELARLKKVIEYLDGMILNVDPELLPLNTWSTFNQQATSCLQQINNYNSNKNINHITEANKHADNLLTYIRPYMVLPKDAAASIKRAAKLYSKTVEDYVDSFQEKASKLVKEIDENKIESSQLISEITATKDTIDEYESKLFGANGEGGTQDEVNKMYTDLVEIHAKLVAFHKLILLGDESNLSLKKEIQQAKDDVISNKEKIHSMLSEIQNEVDDLSDFHIQMFGQLNEDGERTGGLSNKLKQLENNLVEFEKTQKTRYKALNEEIESLMPGATSTGLATAYRSLRRSFNNPLKTYTKVFYLSLCILFLSSLFFIIDGIGLFYINFVDISTFDKFFNNLAYKSSIFLPIIWLAIFSSKRRSEALRLQQEYAHKEALAKSYQSFKKQIDALDEKDPQLLTQLMFSAINAVTYNASKTLDGKHGDEAPTQSFIDKVIDAIPSKKS